MSDVTKNEEVMTDCLWITNKLTIAITDTKPKITIWEWLRRKLLVFKQERDVF